MSPFLTMLIGKILDYLADHADELIAAIKEKFPGVQEDPEVRNALCDLAENPTQENLEAVGKKLEEAGEDPEQVASLIVDKVRAVEAKV